ncbi:MAG: hypothetical protein M1813_000661 [Trichoglossum hirsutum]|jgi:hypothetical protein|nr:MAG: hypothetical protein M1813_000661 [Trichoglossum hirsutum]
MTFCCDEVVEDVGFAVRLLIGRVMKLELLVTVERGLAEEPVADLLVDLAEDEELAPGLADEPVDKPLDESVDEPVEEPVVEEPVAEPVRDLVEDEELELLPTATKELANESIDEPVDGPVVEPVRDLVEDGELVLLDPVPVKPAGIENFVLLVAITEELVAPEPATDPVNKEDREIVLRPDVTRELAEEPIPEPIDDLVKEEFVPPVAAGGPVVRFTGNGTSVGG